MAKQSKQVEQRSKGPSGVEKLRLRISAMINGPRAQSLCQATIWRLDSDSDQAWKQVMEELGEMDGLVMAENEDGAVTLKWEAAVAEGGGGAGEERYVEEMVVQRIEEPAPF